MPKPCVRENFEAAAVGAQIIMNNKARGSFLSSFLPALLHQTLLAGGGRCCLSTDEPSSHLASAVVVSTGGKLLVPLGAACLCIFDFHRCQKGQELWNSIEGQNGNLFCAVQLPFIL